MKAIVNDSLEGKETITIHRFEQAGLGLAPFRFTGSVTEKTFQACHGAPVQAGSTCDFCGTCIRYEFWVQSSDAKTFKVGCDCIHKTEDAGLIQQISKAERELRDQKNKAAKARKAERLAVRVTAAKTKLETVRGSLSSKPHPNSYFAEQGRTLLDYVNWCLANRAEEKACAVIEVEMN